jgi:hypothetical protein
MIAQVAHELVDDFAIEERGDFFAVVAQGRSVLDANHARADYHDVARQILYRQEFVAVDEVDAVEGYVCKPQRARTRRDQALLAARRAGRAIPGFDQDLVRPLATRVPWHRRHLVSVQLVPKHSNLMADR